MNLAVLKMNMFVVHGLWSLKHVNDKLMYNDDDDDDELL